MRPIDADYLINLPFEKMIHTDWGDTAVPLVEIDNAPTVEPERPQGEWVTDDPTYSTWRCNKCLHVQTICFNFCPNCGADMRGGEE